MCLLKPNWLSAVHMYLASRDSKTCSSTLERAVTIAIDLQLLTSAGSLGLPLSSGMTTTCTRVLGSLAVSIQPERNIDIIVSSRSDANLKTSYGIPSLPTAFLFLIQLMYINNIIMALDSPQSIYDLISVISRANSAVARKLSYHRFAILLSPEVPPTVSGRDSFLDYSALISFQKSLHLPSEV